MVKKIVMKTRGNSGFCFGDIILRNKYMKKLFIIPLFTFIVLFLIQTAYTLITCTHDCGWYGIFVFISSAIISGILFLILLIIYLLNKKKSPPLREEIKQDKILIKYTFLKVFNTKGRVAKTQIKEEAKYRSILRNRFLLLFLIVFNIISLIIILIKGENYAILVFLDNALFSLLLCLPVFILTHIILYIPVLIRRLHDMNKSSLFFWIPSIIISIFLIYTFYFKSTASTIVDKDYSVLYIFISFITVFILFFIYYNIFKNGNGTLGPNKYGPDPLQNVKND